jgi:hypothetical protein
VASTDFTTAIGGGADEGEVAEQVLAQQIAGSGNLGG